MSTVNTMEKLLIVEDDGEIRKQLTWGLGDEYAVMQAGDCREALALFKKHLPKVVTLDLGLPPDEEGTAEGFTCLGEILKHRPLSKVIIITGNDERRNALQAVKAGAYDFYQKPIDLTELKVIIKRAMHLHDIEEENQRLHLALNNKDTVMSGIVGQCPAMLKVFSAIRKVAASDASVLIEGESGTGKELVAKAIHEMGLRKDEAFVPINCGAIPDHLLESELFGHEKGSFTGAHMQVQGKLEYAHRGTLFLDEIGELPGHLQVKILRFLQEKTIQRVGGREDIPVDARIIAATNIDISHALKKGSFREDLYYRIGVMTIHLPPLRERGGDVMLLSQVFLRKFSEAYAKTVRGFNHASIEHLQSYAWPGNVRELENRIQRAVLMTESRLIEPIDLGFGEETERDNGISPGHMNLKEARDKLDREMIIAAISKHGGKISKASEDLGVSRPTLYDLIKRHDLFHMIEQHYSRAK
jgi:two-component system NtrC family response regulator